MRIAWVPLPRPTVNIPSFGPHSRESLLKIAVTAEVTTRGVNWQRRQGTKTWLGSKDDRPSRPPLLFRRAMSPIGVAVHRCAMIGDSLTHRSQLPTVITTASGVT